MPQPICASCPFYRPAGVENHGTCHARPPTSKQPGVGRWPIVGYWEFCAEHPDAPRTRTHDMLALIAYRMRPETESRVMHVDPDDAVSGNSFR